MAGLMLVCMLAVMGPFGQMVSWAANTRIAFSDPSVMVGNEVTVTMKITSDSALGKADVMLAYDSAALEFISGNGANGGAGALKLQDTTDAADQKSFSFTLKFKALKAGNTQISVTSQEIYDADSQIVTVDKQGGSTVKVTSPASSSKDAALKSLKISPGELTPEFSPEVDSYTASVDGSTADLVVNAVAANAGASVTLQGDKGLKAGENQVVVNVTAEDGQTVKNYTIVVTKAEGGETTPGGSSGADVSAEFGDAAVTVNGTEYKVAASFDESALPEGFEASTYDYKGTEVMAGKGLEKDLTLLYLQDAGGNGGFYIYNAEADSWSQFVSVETSSKAIVIVPLDAGITVPEGFEERQIDIDGIRVTGWVPKSEGDPQYCLFYAMNWNGEKNFYRYDLTEKTIQRYYASGVSMDSYNKMKEDYNSLVRDYNLQRYILIGVGVLAFILLIVIIVLLKRGGNGSDGGFREERRGRDEEPEGFFTEPESQAGRVRRYSSDEFEGEVPLKAQEEPEDDDFEMEDSLDDMEKKLSAHLAEEIERDTAGPQRTAREQTPGRPQPNAAPRVPQEPGQAVRPQQESHAGRPQANAAQAGRAPQANAGQAGRPQANAGQAGRAPQANAGQAGRAPQANVAQAGRAPQANAGQAGRPQVNAGQTGRPQQNAGEEGRPQTNVSQPGRPQPAARQAVRPQSNAASQPTVNQPDRPQQSRPDPAVRYPEIEDEDDFEFMDLDD